MVSVLELAEYFLFSQDEEADITNLKLQKLCAYCQALSYVVHEKPLFHENMEAWTHGPVIPELYEKYKKFEKNIISTEKKENLFLFYDKFTDDEKLIVDYTKNYYGRITAWGLREMSHRDFNCRFGSKNQITKDIILSSFKSNEIAQSLKNKIKEYRDKPIDQNEKLFPIEEIYAILGN